MTEKTNGALIESLLSAAVLADRNLRSQQEIAEIINGWWCVI